MEENKLIRRDSHVLMQENEIVFYQPNDNMHLEVRMAGETVWLTQQQIALLFGVKQPAISKHLNNIFKCGELEERSVYSILEYTANDGKKYKTGFYNLDAILSVGYRVNSINATMFRKWANSVLKEYLLRGYSINKRFERLEQRVSRTEEKIDFFVRTSLPPVEGIFYEGQIYDAYELTSRLVRSAHNRIVLIDNYIDESVLTLLDKRERGVKAMIYTRQIIPQLLVLQPSPSPVLTIFRLPCGFVSGNMCFYISFSKVITSTIRQFFIFLITRRS